MASSHVKEKKSDKTHKKEHKKLKGGAKPKDMAECGSEDEAEASFMRNRDRSFKVLAQRRRLIADIRLGPTRWPRRGCR